MSAIADIRKDIPIHLELASMTDKEYMSRIMQEVYMSNTVMWKGVLHDVCLFTSFVAENLVCHRKTVVAVTFLCP